MALEKNSRNYPRQRVLKDGKLISRDMATIVDVKIRDMSEKGARVESASPLHLPDRFGLLVVSNNMIYPAAARWQKGNLIGIEFIGGRRPAGLRATKLGIVTKRDNPIL